MEERRKIINGEVHLATPIFALYKGEVKRMKMVASKTLPIIEKDGVCYVVININQIGFESGTLFPIKEKFDELEKVSEKQNK